MDEDLSQEEKLEQSYALIPYRCINFFPSASLTSYSAHPTNLEANFLLFGGINDPCITTILSFLDGSSLAIIAQVCQYLQGAANDDSLWLNLCRSVWKISPDQLACSASSIRGKDLYVFAQRNMQRFVTKHCFHLILKFRVAQDVRANHVFAQSWLLSSQTLQSLTRRLFS
jgi:hypothetical protein